MCLCVCCGVFACVCCACECECACACACVVAYVRVCAPGFVDGAMREQRGIRLAQLVELKCDFGVNSCKKKSEKQK